MSILTMDTYEGALRRVIKERRVRAALKWTELAKAAGMRIDYLHHCMSGKRPVTIATMHSLAGALGTTAYQLNTEANALCNAE